MKIRVKESKVYEYEPEFEEDGVDAFYADHDIHTIEEAFVFDRNWIENEKKGVMEDLDKDPTVTRVWELIGDDDQVIATFP